MTTPEEARRKTLAKLGRKPALKIEDNTEFVGTPVQVRPIYDYIVINGKSYPFLSCYGAFRETIDGEKNSGNTKVTDKWKIKPFGRYLQSELVRWRYPKGSPEEMMHYPEYHRRIRFARLSVLYLKVKDRISNNAKFQGEGTLDAVTLWAMAAHFNRVFDHFPILDLNKAGFDAGGSVALKTVLSFCPRPLIIQSPTEASLFRTADELRPTVGIEEYTTKLRDEVRNAIQNLLDGSFDKGVKIQRTIKNEVKYWDAYGPRAVVDPQGLLSQYSTASRCLIAPLVNAPGMQSSPDSLARNNSHLIQALYDSFLVYADKVRDVYGKCRVKGSGRLDQSFRPLVAVALVLKSEGLDVTQSLELVMRRQIEHLQAIKSEGDTSKQIFAAIHDLIDLAEEGKINLLHRDRTSGEYYVRTGPLRNMISSHLGIEFQSDKGPRGTRYWSRPSKEMMEILQDSGRFTGLLKTFLPDFVGVVESSSRNLCLHYNGSSMKLKEQLNQLAGVKDGSRTTYNFLHVEIEVSSALSFLINNKKIKSLHSSHYVSNRYIRKEVRKSIGMSREECRKIEKIELPNSLFPGSAAYSTSTIFVENLPAKTRTRKRKTGLVENGSAFPTSTEVVDKLEYERFNVADDHGPSTDKSRYLIRVLKPGAEQRIDELMELMRSYGFEYINYQERFGYLFGREISRSEAE